MAILLICKNIVSPSECISSGLELRNITSISRFGDKPSLNSFSPIPSRELKRMIDAGSMNQADDVEAGAGGSSKKSEQAPSIAQSLTITVGKEQELFNNVSGEETLSSLEIAPPTKAIWILHPPKSTTAAKAAARRAKIAKTCASPVGSRSP